MQPDTYFLQKVPASLMKVADSHKEQMSPWRILVPFWIEEMQELGS